mmetsp:Transcript_16091/g.36981  ORF Transcript_16091/g.36981 Transcript_16091/m.36981 type:complete len:223 (+) Transcript_16091:580-1248(+)
MIGSFPSKLFLQRFALGLPCRRRGLLGRLQPFRGGFVVVVVGFVRFHGNGATMGIVIVLGIPIEPFNALDHAVDNFVIHLLGAFKFRPEHGHATAGNHGPKRCGEGNHDQPDAHHGTARDSDGGLASDRQWIQVVLLLFGSIVVVVLEVRLRVSEPFGWSLVMVVGIVAVVVAGVWKVHEQLRRGSVLIFFLWCSLLFGLGILISVVGSCFVSILGYTSIGC